MKCGVPVAFEEQVSPTEFKAKCCRMLPYEVVGRREAHGSYLKRAPHMQKGHVFPRLVIEFFLKTKDKVWKGYDLPCDDPLMIHDEEKGEIHLYDPKQPNLAQSPAKPFLTLSEDEVFTQDDEVVLMHMMEDITRRTFFVLEKAWKLLGKKLVDFKVEFGIDQEGNLLLADVIDNDSWRLLDDGGDYLDKQVYRDGGEIDEVTAKYKQVADLTDRFYVPRQRIILWRGSKNDHIEVFLESLKIRLNPGTDVEFQIITCSAHKQPSRAYRELQTLLAETSNTVIIAYVGMSNGAGLILEANSDVSVITVPAVYKDFPLDVWSSLRAPSNVPVMTMLEPANAVLAALKILAMLHPGTYADLRIEQEELLTDC